MTIMTVQVRRDGNRATLDGPFGEVYFEIDDPDFEIAHEEFAVWAGLPFAMLTGARLRFDVPIDPAVAASAHKLSRIWNAWLPKLWHMVEVDAEAGEPAPCASREHVMAYSGGTDSTYALIRYRRDVEIARALTVHGLDYRLTDNDPFQGLIDRNRKNAEDIGATLTLVRTNLFQLSPYWNYTLNINLATVLWLFAGSYKRAHFAADVARYQDFLKFPSTTNGVTNRIYQGTSFGIDPLGDDVTKFTKVGVLLDHPKIAKRVTFCFDAANTGRNCGHCDKCVRIKLYCLANADTAQPIFDDDRVTESDLRTMAKANPQLSIRELHQAFLLKGDTAMAERMAAMIRPNASLRHGRETPPPWWRTNLNLRRRLGLRS